jgi:O-antigen/teichoic acid export membrane protein
MFFILLFKIKFSYNKRVRKLILLHFSFGNKAALGNIVLGTKPDIIICGFFLSDSLVGIYSFSSTLIDGFLQLFYVFRTNINPLITSTFYKDGKSALQELIKKNIRYYYRIFLAIGIFSIVVFPTLLYILGIHDNISAYVITYATLTTGCIAASGYIPFQMVFNQIGQPRMQTRFLIYIFLFSAIFNVLFIYFWGIYGAAIATSSAFLFQLFLLKRMTSNQINIKI